MITNGIQMREKAMVNSVEIAATRERVEIYQKQNITARTEAIIANKSVAEDAIRLTAMVDVLAERIEGLVKEIDIMRSSCKIHKKKVNIMEIKIAKLEERIKI